MKRTWSINGRFLTQPVTGVQRYAREIVRAMDARLARRSDGLEVELLVPPGAEMTLPLRSIGVRTVGRLKGHLWEQVSLPMEIEGGLLSLCNTGPLAVRRQIVCIHDMNTRHCPGSYSPAFRVLYRALVPALGRSAGMIATVSEYSAAELERFGVCPSERLFVAPNGHEHVRRWTPAPAAGRFAFSARDTIVLLGSPAPHKNIGIVTGLAERLAAAGLRLAIVGTRDPRVFGVEAGSAPSSNVAWLGRLSDDDLAALLGNCLCLAFPSLVEGFGLPPLEAMALGCPVVVSDRASLPEICGDAALYAAPTDADAWFGRFVELARNPALRRRMIGRGRLAARRFSWAASADLYLKAMAALDGVAYVPAAKPPVQARKGAAPDIAPAPTPSIEAIRVR
jgi:glycosyltransferase involved in cell wall biosynthesis